MSRKIYVTRSSLPPYDEYIEAIRPLWETRWLTNMGIYHQELERELKKYLGVDNLSLMVNGHMALELVIQAMGFPAGSEIITTPFTFISTTHAIVRNGMKPVFCDVKMSDGTIDEDKIEDLITEKTVAILPVHVYGNTCNVSKIQKIANAYGLKVIYDAAHAFGVKIGNQGIGTFGDASIFSFHATKIFNTIEGGAVTFSDTKMYDKLYNLKNFGIRGEELVSDIGANAKMNEFSAIMGLCNLNRIDIIIKKRKKCVQRYLENLKKLAEVSFLNKNIDITTNFAYFPILINEKAKVDRDGVYKCLRDHDVYSRKYFYPLTSDQACFKNKYRKDVLPIARMLSSQVLVLPLFEDLTREDIDFICNIISDCLGEK